MRDRFTPPVQRVLTLACEEAQSLGHNYVGTENLLLAHLKVAKGGTVPALKALDITVDKVRERVICTVGGYEAGADAQRPLTPRAHRALEFALEEVPPLGSGYIRPEHIL
ncbi:MAG: hypothetical protein M3305_09130 [Actinomycetota bacterium]|nr:hypothetical protein [Actinomycetota bacterium]